MHLIEEDTENGIYLPHHAVVRNDKDTTKVRVVFDASAKGSEGFSLNNTLIIGPTIQRDLLTLITEWRKFRIAIVGDIVKMYRQVLINEQNTKFQKILWRDNTDEDLKCYELLTVTFGTASAPYVAIRTLLQLAEDEGHNYPIAANILKQSFYVDDLMTGCHDEQEGITIYEQLTNLLRAGGFEMQKWSSNSEELLSLIKQDKNISIQPIEVKLDQHIRILGIIWDRKKDKFKFKVTLPDLVNPITKRKMLSDIARLFDPFGWISPTIIIAKILIQRLWLCNSDWDEEVPPHILTEWIEFRQQLHALENVQIDRWLHIQPDNTHIELHGFADASMSAYAAVIYIKVISDNGIYIYLLESKAKVSPLKQISIARLELCAAVLLAKLISKSIYILQVPVEKVYAYTDSMIVLAWIQSQPMRWQTFVGNRVAEIQNLLRSDRWFHISSEDNPADLASRGIHSLELIEKTIWWQGPSWLINETTSVQRMVPETELEKRQIKIKTHHSQTESPIWERFSSLNRMIRVLTYCRRFLSLKGKRYLNQEQTNYLNSNELKATLIACIKVVQKLDFEEDIMDLKEKNKIKKKSKLLSLSPYLNAEEVLCVGGRLHNAKVAVEVKHPMILSQASYLTWLIVKEAHEKLLHGGYALMINYLRGRYWILGLKKIVKKCVRQCVICIRHKALTPQPLMGILPEVRVNPGRPFECSGVDYAGPIYMRTTKGRGHKAYKGYICLFICMKTRAVHIEAVSDLTSSGFLAAFRQFTSRRGHCSELWSDNGLNFVGAAKELKNMLKTARSTFTREIGELLSNDGTQFKFIPPRAPNFGGLWEAGIKRVKSHLTKVIGNVTLTYEEMSTLLSQIEACLNSRPICQISEHPDDLTPLTPAHFLVGEPLKLLPDKKYENQSITPLERWRLVQKMTQHFWQRWSKEFLHTLQQRTKWHSRTEIPKVGGLVIIKEEHVPPTKWLMGRIKDIHKGQDNEVRILTLKTQTSVLKRLLSKVILLPSNTDEKSNL